MKKILSLLMVVIMCISLFATVSAADVQTAIAFEDIQDHWAQTYIEYISAKGIVNGISEREFAPDRSVTRAEFVALVTRIMKTEETAYDNAYADVSADSWCAGAVQAGKNLGIIDSAMTPDNKFNADEAITREEMVSVLVRAYEQKTEADAPKGDISTFADAEDISDWAKEYMESAYALEITKGTDKNTLVPKATVTRAEAVTMLCRFWQNNNIGKNLKVLSLGNSFSLDSMQYLYQIAEQYGYDNIILGILYIGGCSLEKHYNNIVENKYDYKYYKNTTGTWVITKERCADDGLKDEEWDIFVLQQSSANSGLSETYEPYITNIIEYVKENCPNEDVEFAWNITWAHQHDSKQSSFANNYNSDQMTMYNGIIKSVKEKVYPHKEFSYIIPTGTAVQNARTSYLGDTITRDGYHMDYNFGRYMAALTWFNVLTKNPIDDLTYVPNAEVITESKREIAKESVINAVANPEVITQSEFTVAPEQ